MAKRNAISDLNRDNWDQDDEVEEVGVFKRATDEELQRRVIKTARRRNPGSEESTAKSVFGGFAGFGKTCNATTATTFSFLSNNSNSCSKEEPKISFGLSKDNKNSNSDLKENNNTIYSNVKALNQELCKWVTKHVNENPICNLSPVFDDYKNYINDILTTTSTTTVSSTATTTTTNTKIDASPSSFKTDTTNIFKSGGSFLSQPSVFSLGSSAFGSYNSTIGKPIEKPFTFTNVSAIPLTTPATSESTEGNDDEDQPPKVEFTPVVEDHIYSVKCKIFVRKDAQYVEKGVGQLYIKKIEDSEKKQVLVRANTNIGNILLNTILMPEVPIERIGKNNVMIFCVPTPDAQPPPSCMLIRVATTESADELAQLLSKYAKNEK